MGGLIFTSGEKVNGSTKKEKRNKTPPAGARVCDRF
jgi:hypothetical protein